ncbi:glycoside hydrolase family 16 protein [Aureimonas sp. ME7]|uniref:glycoside hydrolase family 16 protein n=1 Tax=Aureimonas sp. ME7 TaxID=2744252 RepID=UPI0015F4AFB7|nr:glycoside hydrolase family 16 protein [Aureimonas sp. ME7]
MALTRARFLQGLAALALFPALRPAGAASAKRPRPPVGALLYETDFVHGFEVTDSGREARGRPAWRSQFAYDRRTPNNGESGFYSDASVFPGAPDPFPVEDGRRRLRSYRLDRPIECEGKEYGYAAALMSSAGVVDVGAGERAECRFALPHVMRKGYWPAFWLLPADGSWPPEIDVMEWWLFNEGDKPDGFWNSLHTTKAGVRTADQRVVSLPALGLSGDMRDFHTYGVEFTGGEVVCFLDGREISRRADPLPGGRWYIILNVAIGGDPWPGAPADDTPFPQEMVLDSLRVFRIDG